MISLETLQEQVLEALDLSRETSDEELMEIIYAILEQQSKRAYIPLSDKAVLGRELFNAFRKLDILQELLEDEEITEIMINGTNPIFVERGGQIQMIDKKFGSRKKLEDVIQQIVASTNRIVNESTPIVDTRLTDGSRVHVVLQPLALDGPILTIRKFPKEVMTMFRLKELGALNDELIQFFSILVKAKYNIFISGGTGSGKTTFLNALSQYIPNDERIITIEDNAELKIQGIDNLVRLEARNANMEGKGEVTIRDLIRAALRMRPNRIVVGEVRGEEAIDMMQAFNTGHNGSISTGHSNSPRDMLSRLETMVLMGLEIPIQAIQRQIASGIDIIIHLGRLQDKSRKVLEVVEILGYEEGEIRTKVLYQFLQKGKEQGQIKGVWTKSNEITKREKLLAEGYDVEGLYNRTLCGADS